MLLNHECDLLEKVKVYDFGKLRHTITHNTWTMLVKYPKQKRLFDCYEKNHTKPKNEEPESFPPKRAYSSKISKQ